MVPTLRSRGPGRPEGPLQRPARHGRRRGREDSLAAPAVPLRPAKIAMYLQRYHDVAISTSGVWRILKKVGLNRLPASQRYKRRSIRWKLYEKQRPGHQLQVDVKFIEPLGQSGRKKRYYQYTAIDDCTRLRVLRAQPRNDQKTAIQFIDYVLAKLPFAVEQVQTDSGQEFGQAFHWHLLDKGIGHIRIKPRTPRLNGKVERSHRIGSEEFYRLLEGQVIDDVNLFSSKLQEWEDCYNYHRPHGALAGERVSQLLWGHGGMRDFAARRLMTWHS
ncbi:DDE-type integrase/transposase/recombinase [Streptomyces sp. NPDC093060]|uniref:DDE-type integrase/transposase/recombinase n=1 Tax=Streptomyces sp. NPDC093060 TaxID=3366019 RepID=UPI0037FA61D2